MQKIIWAQLPLMAISICLFAAGCDRSEEPEPIAEPATEKQKAQEEVQPGAARPPQPQEEPEEQAEEQTDQPADEPFEEYPRNMRDYWLSGVSNGRVATNPVGPPDEILEQFDEAAAQPRRIDYDPKQWPEQFHQLHSLEVLTPEGHVELPLDAVEIRVTAEGMGRKYVLVTEPSPLLSAISYTFAGPPGIFNDEARVRHATDNDVDDSLAKRVRARLIDEVKEGEPRPPSNFDEIQSAPEEAHHFIRVYELGLPDPYDRLVTLSYFRLPGRPDCLSAIYLLDDSDGQLTTARAPFRTAHCFKPTVFADRNGDGNWSVLYAAGTEPHPFSISEMSFGDDGQPEITGWLSID